MTPTRPLYAPFRAILARLAELGTARRDALMNTPTGGYSVLHHLVELKYVRSVIDPDYHGKKGGKHYVYCLTELGRSVLAAGVVPRKETRLSLNFTMKRNPRDVPVARPEHAHHWFIDGMLVQTWTCQTCGATKETRFSTVAPLADVVGGGRVRKSERYQGFAKVQGLAETVR